MDLGPELKAIDVTTPDGFNEAIKRITVQAISNNRSTEMMATMTERMAHMLALTIVVGTNGKPAGVNALCEAVGHMVFEHAADISKRMAEVDAAIGAAVEDTLRKMGGKP